MSDRDEHYARQAFRRLCIEILRGVVNGTDDGGRIGRFMDELFKRMPMASDRERIIPSVLAELSAKLEPDRGNVRIDFKFKIIRDAIRFAAEACAIDAAAPGRAAQRMRTLWTSILWALK